jgi:cytochrome c5
MKNACMLAIIVSAALFAVAESKDQVSNNSSAAASTSPPKSASPSHENSDDGQRIFEANCSRCHNAPDGFSPRISGTIVRHMRVRASLSAHDEQELLRFFNP